MARPRASARRLAALPEPTGKLLATFAGSMRWYRRNGKIFETRTRNGASREREVSEVPRWAKQKEGAA
jgi:hypothetical protein